VGAKIYEFSISSCIQRHDAHHAYVMKKQGITPKNFNEPFRKINSNTEFECPKNLKLFQNQYGINWCR